MATEQSVTLYYREGGSDKVYQASIEAKGKGFVVNFAYGRRGATLKTGTKTSTPVVRTKAQDVYDKLVREKKAGGYVEGEDGTPYEHTDAAQKATGIFPQLLNEVEESQIEAMLKDDAFWMQEKFDGKRMLVRRTGDDVIGINKRGLTCGLPQMIANAVRRTGFDCLIDGEVIGDYMFVFDALTYADTERRHWPYSDRLKTVGHLIDGRANLELPRTARSEQEKRNLLRELRERNAEGAVFKKHAAVYKAGRPSNPADGTQFKVKFTASATFEVAKVNQKRSVALRLYDADGRAHDVGNVTIPPNAIVPKKGAFVEVRYLYAFRGGAVYQPVYLGPRDDVTLSDCKLRQLKYKTERTFGDDEEEDDA